MSANHFFSVIIPVYRSAPTLDDTISKLLASELPQREIIVMLDCPDNNLLSLADKYKGRVVFDISNERRGKVSSLNKACDMSKGDTFFFLDSDTFLPDEDILERVDEELLDFDIVELKKVVGGNSILAKLVYYEYIGISAADWLISRSTKRTLGMNGAAFAITRTAFEKVGGFRKVVSEDLDFGLRCFEKGLKFKFIDDITIYTFAPSSFSAWLKQRKRWAYGTAKWLKENWLQIMTIVRSKPQVVLPSLLLIFPSLLALLASFTFKDLALWDAFALLFISFPARSFPILLIPFISAKEMSSILSFLAASAIGMVIYSSLYYFFSRKMKLRFSPVWFILYYLFYSPIWLAAMVWGIVRVLIKDEVEIDWKL
jgi:biofilm PGA synthesis N-glycosyltransferase PgaC